MLPVLYFLDLSWIRKLNNTEADLDFPQGSFRSKGPRYLPSCFHHPDIVHSATTQRETLGHHPGHENEDKDSES